MDNYKLAIIASLAVLIVFLGYMILSKKESFSSCEYDNFNSEPMDDYVKGEELDDASSVPNCVDDSVKAAGVPSDGGPFESVPKQILDDNEDPVNGNSTPVECFPKGNLNPDKSTPVRVLSTKIKNDDILTNNKIKKALRFLSKYKNYLLLIINNSSKTNDENINTLRYYGIGAQIIKDLKVKNMILISRRRKKIIGLEGFGLKIKKQIIIK